WEQRKLGEIGKTQSGIGFPDNEQGGLEGVPFFKVSDMNNAGNEHEMKTANNYVSEEQLKRKKWKPIETVPAVMFAKVGAAIMLNRKRIVRTPFLIDNNTMAYVFDESWDTDFGKTLFETINLPRYAQVGALPSYNGSDIESIEISIPNKDEQIKIGSFFSNLDHIITLH
ncbi:restriction endonuclease subunit S, partial [Streptococcus macedonicus]